MVEDDPAPTERPHGSALSDAAAPTPSPASAAWSRRLRGIGSALRHPAFLLVAGALISSYLIPSFTRQWQNRQKELELKSDLVGQITESATAILLAGHTVHINRSPPELARADQTWLDWRIRSAVTGSRLRAYFPNSSLADDWTGFNQELNAFYTITSADDPDHSVDKVVREAMRDGLVCLHASLVATSPAAAALFGNQTGGTRLRRPVRVQCGFVLPIKQAVKKYPLDFEFDLYRVELELYARGNELVDRVLHSHVKSF